MSQNKDFRRYAGDGGVVLLCLGLFAPLTTYPVGLIETATTTLIGDNIAFAVMAVAIVLGLAAILKEKYKIASVAGGIALIWTILLYQHVAVRIQNAVQQDPLMGALVNQIVQISWGWALLLLGAILLIASGLIKVTTE